MPNKIATAKRSTAWNRSLRITKEPKPSPNLDLSTKAYLGLLKQAMKEGQYSRQDYYQVFNLMNHMADHLADERADLIRRIEKLERQAGIKRSK